MNSKLTILADGKPLALNEDASISIELSNPLFNDVDMFSYPVEIPLEGNRRFLKNVDDVNSDIRPVSYEHTPMQIIADGVPFASGTAIIQEDERLEDSLSLNIDASTQSFSDLISDLKCNEVPIPSKYKDQLLIGEKIDKVDVSVKYNTDVVIKYQGKKGNKKYGSVGEDTTEASFSPQALGFSYPAQCVEEGNNHEAKLKKTYTYPHGNEVKIPEVLKSYINVSDPYPLKPYCNARVCYKHYDIDEKGETSSKVVNSIKGRDGEENLSTLEQEMYEDRGPVWVLDANRPQSGICFYVLFFLDCLFEHLGVQFDNSALTAIGDLNRLCFFTTKCAYNIETLYAKDTYREKDKEVIAGLKKKGDVKVGFFQKQANSEKEVANLFDDVNAWLSSRGCGGKLKIENPKDKSVQEVKYRKVTYKVVEKPYNGSFGYQDVFMDTEVVAVLDDHWSTVTVGTDKVASITCKSTIKSAQMSASIFRMYANEQNFPAESVSDVIDSLEQQFGIKFHYDYEQKKVTAYLIRDVFRKQNPDPRSFHAEVLSMVPMTEKITGVRAGYAAESEAKEQKDNVKYAVKDFNTDYDYIEYPKNSTVTSLTYKDIIHRVKNTEMSVFVDLQTGNKYRVKIDKDFTNAGDMKPRLFEVAAMKGVEEGDCSTLNEDYIIEFKSSFVPVGMVDANYRKALASSTGSKCATDNTKQPAEVGKQYSGYEFSEINGSYAKTQMAALIDEDMEHEFVKQYVKNTMSSMVADFYVTEELSLRESYDPSSTDDGNSPLQSYDWGLSVAIMRGGGIDSTHESYDYNYDGFGNSKWRTKAGEYALTTDSIDPYGVEYDCNGIEPDNGNEERFSLKPRAWVQPEWADAPLVVNTPSVKNRGYVDVFLVDYIYFLLHRKKYYVRCLASVAQIADIQNHWKEWWTIDGKKCLINKVNADVSAKEGMGEVELEIYSI
ncbi:hypothetical protein [uncultured Prevotella sp.]|uniref:hypothetical protein n=1 Tax=uncultured Prevotella sp. TaxID=159272 RepID=UPI0027E2AC3D|nr:hypothetical protein [uncultured Prevotella sp.]